jgi:hypothetical protein
MSPRPKAKSPSLFAAAGLERDAPRPLADKLRPDQLADVVGLARLDDLLGAAGHRQDDGRAADRRFAPTSSSRSRRSIPASPN